MSWFKNLFVEHPKVPPDKMRLDAAQERLKQRSAEVNESVDDLTKMFRRLKRSNGQTSRGKPKQ